MTKQTTGLAMTAILVGVIFVAFYGTGVDSTKSSPPSNPFHDAQLIGQWNVNNIISTSPATPAVAIVIPKSRTVEVRGSVYDTDLTPAVGATVWAAGEGTFAPFRERVITDGDGRFVLQLFPIPGDKAVWKLMAMKENRSVKIDADLAWIYDQEPKQPERLVARLLERKSMNIKIRSKVDRSAISDARLYLNDGRVLISDSNGLIELVAIDDRPISFTIFASGHQRQRVNVESPSAANTDLNVYLQPATSIIGTVKDSRGMPIPFAMVSSIVQGAYPQFDGFACLADEQGNFIWDGMPTQGGLRYLLASTQGYEAQATEPLALADSKPVKVTFALPTDPPKRSSDSHAYLSLSEPPRGRTIAGYIRGRVVDSSGNPVKDFRVMAGQPRHFSSADRVQGSLANHIASQGFSFTDEDGRFELSEDIYSGLIYRVTVDGYESGRIALDRVQATDDKDPNFNLFQLTPPVDLKVSVMTSDRTPIEGAQAILIDDIIESDYLQFNWESDEVTSPFEMTNVDGIAVFKDAHIPEGTIAIKADGYARGRFGWRDNQEHFEIVLPPEAVVTAEVHSDQIVNWSDVGLKLTDIYEGSTYNSSLIGDGIFSIKQLPASMYKCGLYLGFNEILNAEFEIAAGETINLKIELDADSPKATLKGITRSETTGVGSGALLVNGVNYNALTFDQGFALFQKYTRRADAKELTSNELRASLLRTSEELNGLNSIKEKEAIVATLKAMANGNLWPRGVKIYAQSQFVGPGLTTGPVLYRVYIPHRGANPSSPTLTLSME